jgi:UDP-N-acetyl-D-glucosamine dehydrogenase
VKVTVIGQGYVGLPIAICAAEAGYIVNGFDIDEKKIKNLKNGVTDSPEVSADKIIQLQAEGKINFSSNIQDHIGSSIFIIAVPTPLDENLKPDIKYLKKACELISTVVKPNDLIVNESTCYIGTLRDLVKPTIQNLSGIEDIDYAVAPERIDPGNETWRVSNTPRIMAGLTEQATRRTIDFYSDFCEVIKSVSKPEVAEAAKLLENTFRQINIGLVNEFSEIASKFNFSANEAINAAATKPFGFMPFYPSIGVGGHCIPVDPSYLAFSAESVGIEAKFINLANSTNSSMPKIIAERIRTLLDGNLSGKKIQIAGIAYKPNVSDIRESPALDLINELKSLGASVSWHDPFVANYNNEQSTELNVNINLGLIITPHDQIDFSIWKESSVKVLDLSANSKNYGWPKFL